MTFLPIVQRELRVASRRRATFRIRFLAAVASALLGGLFLWGTSLTRIGGVLPGRALFEILIRLDFFLAWMSGAFLTADCISREKREGTLGFLFLTDLNGFDVVAGKLAALGLIPIQALIATLPVIGMTVFMGGVTGGEFWRVVLVLVNTLFLSLIVGLWISSLVADERHATWMSIAVLAAIACVPEVLSGILDMMALVTPASFARLAGPVAALVSSSDDAYRVSSQSFWASLGYGHFLGWFLLLIATVVVRRSWRERECREHKTASSTTALKPLRPTRAVPVRKASHPNGPLAWSAGRNTWVSRTARWLAGVVGLSAIGTFLFRVMYVGDIFSAGDIATAVVVVGFYALKLLLAVHAVYFLNDACRSGSMELLLVTPVTSRGLCDGHLAAMRRNFLGPFMVLGLIEVALSLAGTLVKGGDWLYVMGVAPTALAVLVHGLDLIAVAYYASRWALFYDRPGKALLRTTLVALVFPALFCSYGRFIIDVFLIAQNRPLLERFRELARRWYFPGPAEVVFGAPRFG